MAKGVLIIKMKLENIINALKKPVLVGAMLGCLYGASGEFIISDIFERFGALNFEKNSKLFENSRISKIREEFDKRINEIYKMHEDWTAKGMSEEEADEKRWAMRQKEYNRVLNPPYTIYYLGLPSFITAGCLSQVEFLSFEGSDVRLDNLYKFIEYMHRPEMYLANSLLWAGIGAGIGYGVKKIRNKFKKTNLKVKI